MLKKILPVTIVLNIILHSISLIAVEDSIIPIIEQIEMVENLPMKKISKNQYAEIASVLNRKEEKIRLVTYNVLSNVYDHYLEEVNRWPQRLPRIVSMIEEMRPDILSVQELYTAQAEDLLPLIEHTYEFFTRECDDDEINGIFFRKDRFEVIDSFIWYMRNNAGIPGGETLTMLQLKDLKTGKIFAVFNTHLAFSNIEKRDYQVRFVAKRINPVAAQMPIILTGDFNTFPNRPDLEILPFHDGDYIHRLLTKDHLKDAKDVSVLGHLGPLSTFSNAINDVVPFKGIGTPGVFLDHVFVSKEIGVMTHAVQPGTVDGHFPSDHLPVIVDFIIE